MTLLALRAAFIAALLRLSLLDHIHFRRPLGLGELVFYSIEHADFYKLLLLRPA